MILFQGAKRALWKPFTVQVGSIEKIKNAYTVGWTISFFFFCRWKIIKYWQFYMVYPNNITVHVDFRNLRIERLTLKLLRYLPWSPSWTDEGKVRGN